MLIKVLIAHVGIKDLIARIKEKIHCKPANQKPVFFVGVELATNYTSYKPIPRKHSYCYSTRSLEF